MSKTPSVFDVLISAGKKRTRASQGAEGGGHAPRKKQEQAQGSSFQPCPVCSQPIASALLAFHVNGCLEASGSGSKEAHSIAQQQQHPEQHAAGAAAAKAASAARPTSSLAQPSVEASEDRTVSVGGQPASRQGQAKPAEAQPKAAQHSVTPAGNAFSHMMSKQKERAQTWTFYLGREENGRLFWHIWRDVRGTAPIPEIITHCSGHKVKVRAPDQEQVQRCKQQILWSAESQTSLADLECRVDESVDRAAAGKVTLRLCTNIEPRHGGRLDVGSLLWKSGTAGRPWEYTGAASLLKSALQKNIRRGRAEEAVRCAQRLLQSEPGELLRRACVISVEDALLHPQLPLLAFLMAATAKGYTLGRTLASACLQIVHDLAVVPVQDRAPKGQDYSCSPEGAASELALDEAGGSQIRSLLMRAAYGGLQGDVAMLRRFSLLWTARLAGLADPAPGSTPPGSRSAAEACSSWPLYLQATFASARPPGIVVEWGTLGRLKPDDVPAAAVDFHISNIVEDLLGKPHVLAAATQAAAKLGTEPAAALKSAMWHFSGSCNHRSMLQGCSEDQRENVAARMGGLKPLWEAAQPAAEAWAQQYIHARFRPA
ncbi:g3294 [Coccomyxa viridis]|uniref:G3294 protein n=1 Tax=Coccomyxa viridis TaxID=1274662 RepID=A0ABP1FMF7_9CHLO